MANDPIVICPRCAQTHCGCAERRLADELAKLGTGTMNIDVSGQLRWVTSMRRQARTFIVELKSGDETLGNGQSMALRDLTGTLRTPEGFMFDQRAFLVRVYRANIHLSTPFGRSGHWRVMAIRETWPDIARFIHWWLVNGELYFDDEVA